MIACLHFGGFWVAGVDLLLELGADCTDVLSV